MTIAFFDVDETVITSKSMFQFLAYFSPLPCQGPVLNHQEAMANIRAMAERGDEREAINSYYYGLYKNVRQSDVRQAAKRLFASGQIVFHDLVVEKIHAHQQQGHDVVFVSGAMRDIIQPIMDRLGVDTALCSEPRVLNGHYTGVLRQQAIGKGKAVLAQTYAKRQHVPLADCYAYADHISDLPLLDCVGMPCAVNPKQPLLSIAQDRVWPILWCEPAEPKPSGHDR